MIFWRYMAWYWRGGCLTTYAERPISWVNPLMEINHLSSRFWHWDTQSCLSFLVKVIRSFPWYWFPHQRTAKSDMIVISTFFTLIKKLILCGGCTKLSIASVISSTEDAVSKMFSKIIIRHIFSLLNRDCTIFIIFERILGEGSRPKYTHRNSSIGS